MDAVTYHVAADVENLGLSRGEGENVGLEVGDGVLVSGVALVPLSGVLDALIGIVYMSRR